MSEKTQELKGCIFTNICKENKHLCCWFCKDKKCWCRCLDDKDSCGCRCELPETTEKDKDKKADKKV